MIELDVDNKIDVNHLKDSIPAEPEGVLRHAGQPSGSHAQPKL